MLGLRLTAVIGSRLAVRNSWLDPAYIISSAAVSLRWIYRIINIPVVKTVIVIVWHDSSAGNVPADSPPCDYSSIVTVF